jgi:NADH dehydrogenase [ubiquinone] 1 alpha subcomplex assembly factor 5
LATHKRRVPELFDMRLRAERRDRAARIGPELFLLDRVFEDCLDRLTLVRRKFDRALLIGCPNPAWPERLRELAEDVEVADPGAAFADSAGGAQLIEDQWEPSEAAFDVVLTIGTLDTVNDVQHALRSMHQSLRPDGLLLGAVSGGGTLPRLRSAMRAADLAGDGATAHIHPRIEASALATLLGAAGFSMPVVDVDRAQVAYSSLERLVADLRGMSATNILAERSRRPLSRAARAAAIGSFAAAGDGQRTTEVFEILNFAAWKRATSPEVDHG